jgi:hypothetical protein
MPQRDRNTYRMRAVEGAGRVMRRMLSIVQKGSMTEVRARKVRAKRALRAQAGV